MTLSSVNNAELSAMAMFRSKGRVPAVVWRHPKLEVIYIIWINKYIERERERERERESAKGGGEEKHSSRK